MPRFVLRKMPAWNPVKAVAVETGEPVLAMQMGEAFSFHVPDVLGPGKVQRPVLGADGKPEVRMIDGVPMLDAKGQPIPTGRTEEVDGEVVIGHGGMVGGRAGDYVVLWGGEFCHCTKTEVVTVSALEESRAREAARKREAEAAEAAAKAAEDARVAQETADAARREREAARARDEAAQIAAALPRADEVPSSVVPSEAPAA